MTLNSKMLEILRIYYYHFKQLQEKELSNFRMMFLMQMDKLTMTSINKRKMQKKMLKYNNK